MDAGSRIIDKLLKRCVFYLARRCVSIETLNTSSKSDLNLYPSTMVLESDATRKRVIRAKVGAAVNALSLCRNNLKVVVAGRSLLKVYTVDANRECFEEQINLHTSRRTVSGIQNKAHTTIPR